MILLIRVLGPGYTVWDKAASIRFRRPGKERLFARFLLEEEEIAQIRDLCGRQKSVDRVYNIDIVNSAGQTHATVEKTIYVSRKREAGGP